MLFFVFSLFTMISSNQNSLTGAWHLKKGDVEHVLIFQDGYYSYSSFEKNNKKFLHTQGGTFNAHGNHLHTVTEFNTTNKDAVGATKDFNFTLNNNALSINITGEIATFTRTDQGNTDLAGNWRITGRMRDGQMQPMQPGPRKTLKLMSGTRFQWMAINTETKEFFGTGGGTYSFKEGKYTENIEFFSRDSTRVGASLTFEGSVNNKVWTHKGLSSRGEPIHEEWSRQ